MPSDLRPSGGREQGRVESARSGPFPLEVTWVEGPRNAAWDELWRRIFADVLGTRVAATGTREPSPDVDRTDGSLP